VVDQVSVAPPPEVTDGTLEVKVSAGAGVVAGGGGVDEPPTPPPPDGGDELLPPPPPLGGGVMPVAESPPVAVEGVATLGAALVWVTGVVVACSGLVEWLVVQVN